MCQDLWHCRQQCVTVSMCLYACVNMSLYACVNISLYVFEGVGCHAESWILSALTCSLTASNWQQTTKQTCVQQYSALMTELVNRWAQMWTWLQLRQLTLIRLLHLVTLLMRTRWPNSVRDSCLLLLTPSHQRTLSYVASDQETYPRSRSLHVWCSNFIDVQICH